MGRIAGDEAEPGPFEVELVHPRGPSTAGDYVPTLPLIAVAPGWSERVAVRGRRYRAMVGGFEQGLQRLPCAVRALHPDNGPEVLRALLGRSAARARLVPLAARSPACQSLGGAEDPLAGAGLLRHCSAGHAGAVRGAPCSR